MAGLICLACALNYLDRQTLSVLAVTVQRDLSFSPSNTRTSRLVSGQLHGDVRDERPHHRLLGTRRSFCLRVGVVAGHHRRTRRRAASRICRGARFLLGAVEPANFPAGVKAVSEWFPMRERALAAASSMPARRSARRWRRWSSRSSRWPGAGAWRSWSPAALGSSGWGVGADLLSAAEHPRLSAEERALILRGRVGETARRAARRSACCCGCRRRGAALSRAS